LSIIFFRGIVDGMPGILYLNPLPSAARVVDDWGVQSSGPWSVHIEMSDRAIPVADDMRKFIT
jgi:hypothetical protein